MSILSKKINLKALGGPALVLISFLASPEFLNTLPDKYAYAGMVIGALISTLVKPLVVRDPKPPTE